MIVIKSFVSIFSMAVAVALELLFISAWPGIADLLKEMNYHPMAIGVLIMWLAFLAVIAFAFLWAANNLLLDLGIHKAVKRMNRGEDPFSD